MILPGSRYYSADVVVTRLPDSNGVYQQTVLRPTPIPLGDFTNYTWQEGDRPDIVAQKFFGDPTLWWAVFDANPELIYPLNIPIGTVVRIPSTPILGNGTLVQ